VIDISGNLLKKEKKKRKASSKVLLSVIRHVKTTLFTDTNVTSLKWPKYKLDLHNITSADNFTLTEK